LLKHSRIRTAMLAWYDAQRRDLPWRGATDPYRVWIAEVMLHQTRVETVASYYQRWLAAFPDIASLAAGELAVVLEQWKGLGYYSRARHLHRAARLVRELHAGQLPADYAAPAHATRHRRLQTPRCDQCPVQLSDVTCRWIERLAHMVVLSSIARLTIIGAWVLTTVTT
jgi:adenine-specific DNA glycosylase